MLRCLLQYSAHDHNNECHSGTAGYSGQQRKHGRVTARLGEEHENDKYRYEQRGRQNY